MYRLTAKNLWAHKLRLLLTGLAVVLGVAFMTGTTVLTDTMGRTFDETFDTANAGIDVVVQQPQTLDVDQGVSRNRVPAAVVDQVRAVEGVESAVGSIQGFAQLVDANGEVAPLDGLEATIGTNWIADGALNPFDLASGREPQTGDEVVIDQRTAGEQGWSLGDRITVLAKGQPTELAVVGTARFGTADGVPGASLVAVNDETAQRLFAEPGHYDGVVVAAADGVDPATLAAGIDATLGAGAYDVVTGEADAEADKDSLAEDLSFFNTFLLAFAYVSLFVGTFIIYNTFSILAAQRSKDMAMLRAIGAGRGQLLRSLVVESAVVGVVSGAIGLVAGVGMSVVLRNVLAAAGIEIPDSDLVVSSGTIVTAFVVGVGVTVISALGPAARASRVRPIAALRDVAVEPSGVSVRRAVAGALLTAAGAAAFAAGVVGDGSSALQLLGLGALTTFLGMFVLGPVIARPVVRAAGAPVQLVARITGRLGRENASRSPRRTAATASALMVGVALVGFITILAASTKASVTANIDRSFRAEYVLRSGAFVEGGFNPALAAELEALPEVDAVGPVRYAEVEVDDAGATLSATDTSTINGLFDLQVVDGSVAELGAGRVAVSAPEAANRDLAVGDVVDVTFVRTGTAPYTVVAIYDAAIDAGYLVDLATYEANVTDQYDQMLFVSTADGVDAAASRAALERVLEPLPNAELQDQAQFKEGIADQIDKMLNLVYGLLVLAVVIALLGIANTLALSIHERRREIGLLRAVGMTRHQVRSTVRWEAVLIALFGTALGMVLAMGLAWGIVQALADQSITTFAVPGSQLGIIAVVATLAGVGAAVGPARRAAKLDVLAAISTS